MRVSRATALQTVLINFTPLRLRSYCNQYVCLSVCLSARIIRKPSSRTLPNVCACCPWPWHGPPLMTLQHVGHFRFYD